MYSHGIYSWMVEKFWSFGTRKSSNDVMLYTLRLLRMFKSKIKFSNWRAWTFNNTSSDRNSNRTDVSKGNFVQSDNVIVVCRVIHKQGTGRFLLDWRKHHNEKTAASKTLVHPVHWNQDSLWNPASIFL